MKKKGHPKYQEVLFEDTSTGFQFVCGSTLQSDKKGTFEGKEYPKCEVAVSSSSHPFFTKEKKYIDTEGRVEKFQKRYKNKKASQQKKEKEAEKEVVKKGKAPVKKKAPAKKGTASKKAPVKKKAKKE